MDMARVAVCVGVGCASSAWGQLLGVRAGGRASADSPAVTGGVEDSRGTGWSTTAPVSQQVSAAQSGTDVNGRFTSGACVGVTTADIGRLSLDVSASASGDFGTAGGWAFYDAGPGYNAEFFDSFTVLYPGQPNATPVRIRFTMRATGGVSWSHPLQPNGSGFGNDLSVEASMYVNGQGGVVRSVFPPASGGGTVWPAEVVVDRDFPSTTNGNRGRIDGIVRGRGAQNSYASASSFSLQGTATYWVEVLTPGASVVFASGRSYALCEADFTGDGRLDVFDILGFFGAFGGGQMTADVTGDGVLNVFDVLEFFAGFGAGC